MIYPHQLFQAFPSYLPFAESFPMDVAVFEWVPRIAEALKTFFQSCPQTGRIFSKVPPQLYVTGDVYIGENVQLPPFGYIEGPTYIGKGCVLRPGVYIRGNVIAGKGCVLGNSCEFKNALLLEYVQASHFNYVGDSIMGSHTHLGAGCILSNLRFDQQPICMRNLNKEKFNTGLRKLGAILGDHAEAGCNAVLLPGACLFPYTQVLPCEAFGGTRA